MSLDIPSNKSQVKYLPVYNAKILMICRQPYRNSRALQRYCLTESNYQWNDMRK